jgi:hypothetical protein
MARLFTGVSSWGDEPPSRAIHFFFIKRTETRLRNGERARRDGRTPRK